MKNKLHKLLGLGFLTTLVLLSCTKVDLPSPVINLGVVPTSTNINKVTPLTTGTITAEFAVTKDAKYSVQIVPFGVEDPVKTFGFTADANVVTKNYDLSSLPSGDYTLIFIDVVGKEIKQQITIKK
jgi:hypothetical protein